VISIAACCHSAKLCAHASRAFRSQQNDSLQYSIRSFVACINVLTQQSFCFGLYFFTYIFNACVFKIVPDASRLSHPEARKLSPIQWKLFQPHFRCSNALFVLQCQSKLPSCRQTSEQAFPKCQRRDTPLIFLSLNNHEITLLIMRKHLHIAARLRAGASDAACNY